MADSPQTLSGIVLAAVYRDRIVKAINRKSVGLSVFPIIESLTGQIRWAVDADGQIAENYSEGADVANYGSDAQAPASLSWGLYRSPFRVTDLAQSVARRTANPQDNTALWAKNVVDSAGKLASTINAAMYAGAGTGTTIAGLGVAAGNAANTYAGIDRASAPYWRPYVIDPGSSTTLTEGQIRTDIKAIYQQCGETPDLALVSPDIFQTVTSLVDSKRQYVDQVTTAAGDIKLRMGAQAVEVDGCVFIRDKDATANQIFYCNSGGAHWEVLPMVAVPAGLEGIVQADDGFGMVPLSMNVEQLARTGASVKGVVSVQIQFVVEKPFMFGVRKNVA